MTGEPVTEPAIARLAVTSVAFLLLLSAASPECIAAPRVERAVPEASTFLIAVAESIDTGGELFSRAGSPGRGHGLQLAGLSIDSGKLGGAARKAVNRWPAAQEAEPSWDWVRVLVFLVQNALIVQGQDPGKLDGLMGPKTMLALLAWSAASGPSWDGNEDSSKAYRWGLNGNVAHLLHGTLEAEGLAPGPKDRLLGRESVTALERWDGTFRRGGLFIRISEDVGRDIVMSELGASGPSDSGEATGRSTAQESADRSGGRGYTEYECLKISWSEATPICHSGGYSHVDEGECIWVLDLNNSCSHGVVVHLLVDRKDGRGPFWEDGGRAYEAGEAYPIWDTELPEHIEPEVRYCAHKYDHEVRDWPDNFVDSTGHWWYRNEFRDAQGETQYSDRTFWDANFVPNPTCMDTY